MPLLQQFCSTTAGWSFIHRSITSCKYNRQIYNTVSIDNNDSSIAQICVMASLWESEAVSRQSKDMPLPWVQCLSDVSLLSLLLEMACRVFVTKNSHRRRMSPLSSYGGLWRSISDMSPTVATLRKRKVAFNVDAPVAFLFLATFWRKATSHVPWH